MYCTKPGSSIPQISRCTVTYFQSHKQFKTSKKCCGNKDELLSCHFPKDSFDRLRKTGYHLEDLTRPVAYIGTDSKNESKESMLSICLNDDWIVCVDLTLAAVNFLTLWLLEYFLFINLSPWTRLMEVNYNISYFTTKIFFFFNARVSYDPHYFGYNLSK